MEYLELDERLNVVVVSNEANVPHAIRQLIARTEKDLKVFGLDCEWDVVTKKKELPKPDILQIATVHGFCALFRLHLLQKIPTDLKGFLEDPYFMKVGVGVLEDRDKLNMFYGVKSQGVIDVRHLADELLIPPRGLSYLTKSVLDVDMFKPHYDFHQWTGKLSHAQRLYAALDAIYSARVFYKMSHERLSQIYGDEWYEWTHANYHDKTLSMWNKYFGKPFDFLKCKFNMKTIIDCMISFSDLTLELGPETEEDVKKARGTTDPGKLDEFPTFEAKFGSKIKQGVLKRKEKKEKIKKVPKRYTKKFIRRMEAQGVDPMTIPTCYLSKGVLDEEGNLDMSKI